MMSAVDVTAVLVGLGAAALALGAAVALALQSRIVAPPTRTPHPLVGSYVILDGERRRIATVEEREDGMGRITYEGLYLPRFGFVKDLQEAALTCQKCDAPLRRDEEVRCARCISDMAGG